MTVRATTNTAQTPGNVGKLDVKLSGLNPGATYLVMTELQSKGGTPDRVTAPVSGGESTPGPVKKGSSYRVRSFTKMDPDTHDGAGDPLDDDTVAIDPANGDLVVKSYVPALLDLVVASLALDRSTPRKGCEGGQALHNAWLDHLAAAYKPGAGVPVSDNAGAFECINGAQMKDGKLEDGPEKPKTSCSQTVGNAFRNFGIPKAFLGGSPSTALVAFPSDDGKQRGYLRKLTPDTLPRAGDPYYLVNSETNKAGSPRDHHAIFGQLIGSPKEPPYNVGDYSGGQAPTGTAANPTSKDKMDALFSQRTLIQKGNDIYASGLPTGGVGEVPGGFRRVMVYTDMWQFFQDNAAGVADPGKRGSLK